MLRRLKWISAGLLLVTLIYWAIAAKVGVDFRNLSGDAQYPMVSGVIGRNEVAWLVDRRLVLLWWASDPSRSTLPLVGRHGLVGALFNAPQVRWTSPPRRVAALPFLFQVVRFEGTSATTGTPIHADMILVPLSEVAVLFSILPALSIAGIGYRRTARWLRYRRRLHTRRKQASLGRCPCGYDLRGGPTRCPECGRRVRMVPVAVGPPRAQGRIAG